MILLDTSILVRLPDTLSADRQAALAAVARLLRGNEILSIVPQNIYEFWAVATRRTGLPSTGGQNGLGMSADRALLWLRRYQHFCQVLPETPDVLVVWQDLITRHGITGYRARDLRLVAAMLVHGIASVLTLNTKHFTGYGVQVVDPRTF